MNFILSMRYCINPLNIQDYHVFFQKHCQIKKTKQTIQIGLRRDLLENITARGETGYCKVREGLCQ